MSDTPLVGIFWFIADAAAIHLLAHTCPLTAAEPYADCLTSADGHYEIWSAWRRHTQRLPLPALRPIIAQTEYETWPRGRVVYETQPARFVVYADVQLIHPARLARIHAAFELPPDGTIARTDPHYSRATRLPLTD